MIDQHALTLPSKWYYISTYRSRDKYFWHYLHFYKVCNIQIYPDVKQYAMVLDYNANITMSRGKNLYLYL